MAGAQLIIGVTGHWKSRTELVQEVATKSGGYLLAGGIIYHTATDCGFEIDVYEHDPNLVEAFAVSGRDMGEELLHDIESHTYTVYIIAEVKDLQTVKDIINVGMGLLQAGGIAVKVETTGTTYAKGEWEVLAKNPDIFPMYTHFVTLIGDEETYYSCGMQSFGLPDVMIANEMDPQEAADFLNEFNLYYLVEKPLFCEGETFSMGESAPIYKLSKLQDMRYEDDDPFYNPCGIWRLQLIEESEGIL